MLGTCSNLIDEYLHVGFQFIKYLGGIDCAMDFILEFTYGRILENDETLLRVKLGGEELHGEIVGSSSLQSDWFLFAEEGREGLNVWESLQPLLLECLLLDFLFLLCHGESLLLFLWSLNKEGDLIDYDWNCECSYLGISKLVGNSDLEFLGLIKSGTNSPYLLGDSFGNDSLQLINQGGHKILGTHLVAECELGYLLITDTGCELNVIY